MNKHIFSIIAVVALLVSLAAAAFSWQAHLQMRHNARQFADMTHLLTGSMYTHEGERRTAEEAMRGVEGLLDVSSMLAINFAEYLPAAEQNKLANTFARIDAQRDEPGTREADARRCLAEAVNNQEASMRGCISATKRDIVNY